MKFSLVFVCVCAVVITILSTQLVDGQRMQSSLLYGRRSAGTGMSGPGFGKRTSLGLEPLDAMNEVKHACAMLVGYVDIIKTTSAA